MAMKKDIFTKLRRLGDPDDQLDDYERWRQLGDEARFAAAWELVITAHKLRGEDISELRLQRSIENLIRK